MEEVALSLSGGGYRAAMFHLGTLSYLHHLKLSDGRCFLDIVNTISTISGGTITGLWYMLSVCHHEDLEKSFGKLYHLLIDSNIPKDVYNSFFDKANTNHSLIKEMVSYYDKTFFHGATFGMIMEEADQGHIHHFSSNGTDFTNGIAFRFQASRKIHNVSDPKFQYGFIGNNYHEINREIASKIKLSEILAVSSCFPGGFEPMIYPKDFSIYDSLFDGGQSYSGPQIPLMDGGIVDNQGIESLLLANSQMTYDNPKAIRDSKFPCHDLIIVSDVSSAKQGDYEMPIYKPISGSLCKLTIGGIGRVLNDTVIIMIALTIAAYFSSSMFFVGITSTLTVLSALVAGTFSWMRNKFKHVFERRLNIDNCMDVSKLSTLTVGKMQDLLLSRLTSLLRMAQFVFMKPIRQLRYKQLYEDGRWTNRLISNIITELSSYGSWKYKKLPVLLQPSNAMMQNSDLASSMNTTLWFTNEDKKKGIPQSLFSCGQYNICWNLLEYIEKLKKTNENPTDAQQLIINCEAQLRHDWEQFKTNPQFLING